MGVLIAFYRRQIFALDSVGVMFVITNLAFTLWSKWKVIIPQSKFSAKTCVNVIKHLKTEEKLHFKHVKEIMEPNSTNYIYVCFTDKADQFHQKHFEFSENVHGIKISVFERHDSENVNP